MFLASHTGTNAPASNVYKIKQANIQPDTNSLDTTKPNTEKAKTTKKTKDTLKDFVGFVAQILAKDINEDIKFIAQKDPSMKSIEDVVLVPPIGLMAVSYYRIANFFVKNYDLGVNNTILKERAKQLSQDALVRTTIDIHPFAQIGVPFFIDHGHGVVVGETTVVGERCTLFNGVILGSKNVLKPKQGKRHPTLKDNVTVCAGAKIFGDIVIGNNVFVSPSSVVLEDIEDNHQVIIINQLQVKKQTTYSYLPSQQLVVYGIVPKFKNGINILGEGFYNPTVLIKLKNGKELNYEITYWEKNKIMIKFKNTPNLDKETVKGVKMIVFSNSNRVVVLGNLALEKALTSLND